MSAFEYEGLVEVPVEYDVRKVGTLRLTGRPSL